METWFTFENLYKAYRDCRKGKSASLNCLRFSYALEDNLLALERELVERTYRPGRSIAFIVQRPKIREIFAAEFRDRVVHHLLFNYLSPRFERAFIHDSWACRKGKGTHRASLRLRQFMAGASQDLGKKDAFYLKMDIRSFFTSIDQEILYNLVTQKIKNQEILWLARTIIFHDCARDIPPKRQSSPALFNRLPAQKSLFKVPKGKGLPIGNLTSQFFANVYLNELDQYVKHNLKARRYLRYVDDLVVVGERRETLERFRDEFSVFTANRLALRFHPAKTVIRPLTCGIDFVGYFARFGYTLARRRTVSDWRRRLESLRLAPRRKGRQAMESYLAHAKWADAYWLQQKMLALFPRFRPLPKGRLDELGKIEFLNLMEE
ncbi:RNA-directed DNA polymerase [Patescibacteria group bacterium]|nr:RNA-directed DNA polymerase [Patescibacteria group bacterium]